AKKSAKTEVEFVDDVPAGYFYLRVGLGRKASGSYYTPHPFVKFLVQEALESQCEDRSPKDNPNPAAFLSLKVLDPAMGSGHFLVEACRFLGERLYEACRMCDTLAADLDSEGDAESDQNKAKELRSQAASWRSRVTSLPDIGHELLSYMPS